MTNVLSSLENYFSNSHSKVQLESIIEATSSKYATAFALLQTMIFPMTTSTRAALFRGNIFTCRTGLQLSYASPTIRCSVHGQDGKPYSEILHLPQTIEYATKCAQEATQNALLNGITRILVELPMGRNRKNWYRMSPRKDMYEESSLLALHFCEMFKGGRIRLILGSRVALGIDAKRIPWIDKLEFAGMEEENGTVQQNTFDVVVVAAVGFTQAYLLQEAIDGCPAKTAVILFNCCLEEELGKGIPEKFVEAYVCRAVEKGAVLKHRSYAFWHVYAETSVFDFDWVCRCPSIWRPTCDRVEEVLVAAGAQRKSGSGYYEKCAGQEAGFWPFMTAASPLVLPVQGIPPKLIRTRKSRAPFGFF